MNKIMDAWINELARNETNDLMEIMNKGNVVIVQLGNLQSSPVV